MKVIIPMAGRGTRLRPHTLVTPKPLLKVAGKTIIEWIVNEIQYSVSKKIEAIHFVIGDFGRDVEKSLIDIAEKVGCKGYIHYQTDPLGTAHAIYCAKDALKDKVFIAFADTIFKGKILIDDDVDGIIWTMVVDEPEKYGVVKTDSNSFITEFIEKPKIPVSRNAIVGLYYFKNAEKLRFEIERMLDNNIKENNEFQITNCLEELKNNGNVLKCDVLDEWLDCGNMNELIATNKRLIELSGKTHFMGKEVNIKNSKIEDNSFISDNVEIIDSQIENCIIYSNTVIKNSLLKNSIVGNYCEIINVKGEINIGDYSKINNK